MHGHKYAFKYQIVHSNFLQTFLVGMFQTQILQPKHLCIHQTCLTICSDSQICVETCSYVKFEVNLKENLTVLMHLNLIESHICKFNIEVFQYIEYKDTQNP